MLIEKSIFIEKRARKNKFYVLFFTIGLLIVAATGFNLDLHTWMRPPNLWTSMTNLKCQPDLQNEVKPSNTANTFTTNVVGGSLIGMKSTFLESSILICVPTMVFASAFSITL